MLVASAFELFKMITALAVASAAGLSLVRFVPWTNAARRTGVPAAAGLVAGPFLLGLAAVVSLSAFGGASHGVHLTTILVLLLGIVVAGQLRNAPLVGERSGLPWPFAERALAGLLIVWFIGLVGNAVLLPLAQNDSLEYALVGRTLWEVRDLSAYPALDPAAGRSGFYGPWTHPPLYVALIYVANALQGHADYPGALRLIAPWVATVSTLLVVTLGSQWSRFVGLLAGLIFLSVPLFFLGADSALIDALPVAGLTLVIAALVAVQTSPRNHAVVVGLVVGLALWTHSQAVLFLPLALAGWFWRDGWKAWKQTVTVSLWIALCATLVGIWPYLKNVWLYGSLIRDNAAVWEIDPTGWREYFSLSRGLSSWPEIVQYGVFKGWFSLEAYSFAFWWMILGWIALWRGCLSTAKALDPLARVAAGVVGCYLAGVVVSVLLGLDLMIKNERYLLVLIPMVALFGALGIAWLFELGRRLPPVQAVLARLGLFVVLGLALFSQLGAITFYRWRHFLYGERPLIIRPEEKPQMEAYLKQRSISFDLRERHGREFFAVEKGPEIWIGEMNVELEAKLLRIGSFELINQIDRVTPPDAVVLALRPADMFYAHRRMISYLDPRLIPFYQANDAEAARESLVQLGVGFIQAPDYSFPAIYNTRLQELLARPDLTRLIAALDGNQLYAVNPLPAAERAPLERVDISPATLPWIATTDMVLGGRKSLWSRTLTHSVALGEQDLFGAAALPFFQRDYRTVLLSGLSDRKTAEPLQSNIVAFPNAEYRLTLQAEGHAFLRIFIQQLDQQGEPLRHGPWSASTSLGGAAAPGFALIGEVPVSKVSSPRQFVRRFQTYPDARYLRVGIEYKGASHVRLSRATLERLSHSSSNE